MDKVGLCCGYRVTYRRLHTFPLLFGAVFRSRQLNQRQGAQPMPSAPKRNDNDADAQLDQMKRARAGDGGDWGLR